MRHIKIYFFIAVCVGLFSSCDNSMDKTFNGPWFVHTMLDSKSVLEAYPDVITVPVQRTSDDYSLAVEVQFEVKGENAVEGIDFEVLNESRTLTFAAGVVSQEVDIRLIDNAEEDGDKKVIVQLVSSSGNLIVGNPGPDQLFSSFELFVQDDDCAFVPADYSKELTGYETPVGQTWWVEEACPFQFEYIEEVESKVYKFEISGFWYAQIEGKHDYPWIEEGDQTEYPPITAYVDLRTAGIPKITLEPGVCAIINKSDGEVDSYTIESGERALDLNTCNKTMSFTYTLDSDNASWARGYQFSLTFQF